MKLPSRALLVVSPAKSAHQIRNVAKRCSATSKNTKTTTGLRLFHLVRGLLVCFLDFGFSVCGGSETRDRLAKGDGSGSGDFRFERVEAAGMLNFFAP